MKKYKSWIFWALITASIFFCCWSFRIASGERVVNSAIGGEVFTIALPLWLISKKIEAMTRANKHLRKKVTQLERALSQSQLTADVSNVAAKQTR